MFRSNQTVRSHSLKFFHKVRQAANDVDPTFRLTSGLPPSESPEPAASSTRRVTFSAEDCRNLPGLLRPSLVLRRIDEPGFRDQPEVPKTSFRYFNQQVPLRKKSPKGQN